MNTVQKIH